MNKILSQVALALTLVVLAIQATSAADPKQQYQLDVPAQPVTRALSDFARQTNLQIVYYTDVAEGLSSAGAAGALAAEDALNRILSGTGLAFIFLNERTVAIRAPQGKIPLSSSKEAGGDAEVEDEEKGTGRWLQLAQTDSTSKIDIQGSEAPNTSSAPSDEKGGYKLEEIIVTAQKREERLQDVPISISVLRGEDLDKSTAQGVTEALNRVPGVATTVGFQGGGTLLAARGVTAAGSLFYGSSPIAYYLDSVPFGLVKSAIAPDANAYDLERVEVLRGPQGTLYGANALNGVVRVLTRDADPNRFEFKMRTLASATDEGAGNYRGDLAVNVPVVDGKLAVRAVAGYQDMSGWIDRPGVAHNANDSQLRNVRLKVNAQPTENLSIGLSAWASRTDIGGQTLADDNALHRGGQKEPIETDYEAYSAKVVYEFPVFSLTSMTSYLEYLNDSSLDFGPSGLPTSSLRTTLDAKVFAQEIVLNSMHEGSWRWSLGGIYRDASDVLYQLGTNLGYLAPSLSENLSESYALFGELTRTFLDGRLELTGGLRYFEDDVGQRERSRLTAVPASELRSTDSTFDATTPRLVLTWHPSDRITTYASYSEGFRSGSDQSPAVLVVAPLPSVKPDSLKNYEIGIKGGLFDRRLEFETAVYYIDWRDVQQPITVAVATRNLGAIVNGESASGIGFDFALATQPIDSLNLGLTFGWNDLAADVGVISGGVLLFPKGSRLNYSPEYTAGATAEYLFPLGGGGLQGRFSAGVNYTSEQTVRQLSGGTARAGVGDSMLISRAHLAIEGRDRWTATLFVDNLNNETDSPIRFSGIVAFQDWDARVRPRTMGVQIDYRF